MQPKHLHCAKMFLSGILHSQLEPMVWLALKQKERTKCVWSEHHTHTFTLKWTWTASYLFQRSSFKSNLFLALVASLILKVGKSNNKAFFYVSLCIFQLFGHLNANALIQGRLHWISLKTLPLSSGRSRKFVLGGPWTLSFICREREKRKLTPYALHPPKPPISLMMRHERKGGSAV